MICSVIVDSCLGVFFFQAEDGIRDLVRSRGLGDVYKRQAVEVIAREIARGHTGAAVVIVPLGAQHLQGHHQTCLLYTSDAADERSSVDLGGRRIIKQKNTTQHMRCDYKNTNVCEIT